MDRIQNAAVSAYQVFLARNDIKVIAFRNRPRYCCVKRADAPIEMLFQSPPQLLVIENPANPRRSGLPEQLFHPGRHFDADGRPLTIDADGRPLTMGDFLMSSLMAQIPKKEPVPAHVIRKLKSLVMDEKTLEVSTNESETCTICCESYKLNDQLITLNCKHRFHEGCVLTWFDEKDFCPLCKVKVSAPHPVIESVNPSIVDENKDGNKEDKSEDISVPQNQN